MNRYILVAMLCANYSGVSYSAESRFDCPPQIQTTQSLKGKAPDGWTSIRETRYPQWLKSIAIFDGPPNEHADLVPDNEVNQDPEKTVWTFNKKKDRSLYLACEYSGTEMLLVKELSRHITQCRMILSISNPPSGTGLLCK